MRVLSFVLAGIVLAAAGHVFGSEAETGDPVEAAVQAGREAIRAKDYPTAVGHFERATRLSPDDAGLWFKLGLAQGRAKNQEGAIAAYRRVVELEPGHAKAHHNLGNIYFRRGETEASAESYGLALEADPDYLLAAFHYGWVLRQINRVDEAAKAFERCIEIPSDSRRGQKTHVDCLFGLGSLRHRAGDYETSAKLMEQVIGFFPSHPEARYYLGMAYRQLGRMDEAREQLEIHTQMMDARRNTTPIERKN